MSDDDHIVPHSNKVSLIGIKENSESYQRRTGPRILHKDRDRRILIRSKKDKWAIQDIVRTGCATLLAAAPKFGKSTAFMDMARAVVFGEKFWNRYQAKKGKVLLFNLNDSEDSCWDRVFDVTGEREEEFSKNIAVSWELPRVGSKNFNKAFRWDLEKFVEDNGELPTLVGIDLYRDIAPNANEYKDLMDREQMVGYALRKIASQYSIGIICLDHTNKSSGASIQDRYSGTMGKMGAFDTTIVARFKETSKGRNVIKDKNIAEICVESRSTLKYEDTFKLKRVPGKFKWEVMARELEAAKAQARKPEIRKILAFAKKHIRQHGPTSVIDLARAYHNDPVLTDKRTDQIAKLETTAEIAKAKAMKKTFGKFKDSINSLVKEGSLGRSDRRIVLPAKG